MHNSHCGLSQRVPGLQEKVPRWYRSAGVAIVGPALPGCMGAIALLRLRRCSVPNASSQACCCSPVRLHALHGCLDRVWTLGLLVAGLLWRLRAVSSTIPACMHGRLRLLVQPSTRTSQQHCISANLLARRAPVPTYLPLLSLDNNTTSSRATRRLCFLLTTTRPFALLCCASRAVVLLLLLGESHCRSPDRLTFARLQARPRQHLAAAAPARPRHRCRRPITRDHFSPRLPALTCCARLDASPVL